MPDKTIHVSSAAHFDKLLSSSTYTIVDFYADWCGPCKAIAPVFNNLAEKESKPGRIQFAKVNVDNQPEIAQKYGVSAYVPALPSAFSERSNLPTNYTSVVGERSFCTNR